MAEMSHKMTELEQLELELQHCKMSQQILSYHKKIAQGQKVLQRCMRN